jgi:hypothetical protein
VPACSFKHSPTAAKAKGVIASIPVSTRRETLNPACEITMTKKRMMNIPITYH